jgi:hypothetical protein
LHTQLEILLPRELKFESNVATLDKEVRTTIIEYNFKEVVYVSLPGLMNLLLQISTHNENRFTSYGTGIISFIGISSSIIVELLSSGLLYHLVKHNNLVYINQLDIKSNYTLLSNENLLINRLGLTSKKSKLNYLPIAYQEPGIMGQYEYFISGFRNKFRDYFFNLLNAGYFNKGQESQNNLDSLFFEFSAALFEMPKNIYDHSFGQGYCGMVCSQITFCACFYDNGIGIVESMKKCNEYAHLNEKRIFELAFQQNVSSKRDSGNNSGMGLYKIFNFIEKSNGIFVVRSSGFMFNNGKIRETSYAKGTHVVIYIPIL